MDFLKGGVALGKLRLEDCGKFKASLGHKAERSLVLKQSKAKDNVNNQDWQGGKVGQAFTNKADS